MSKSEEALFGGKLPSYTEQELKATEDPQQKELFLCFEALKMAMKRIETLERQVSRLRRRAR